MILTDRTWYREGDTARVSGFSSDGNAVVSHLDTVVRTVPVLDGEAEIPLEGLPLGGYGVTHETTQEQTAFDVLTSPFERPRYGFVTTLDGSGNPAAMVENFRQNHLNLAQFYDWAFKHSTLMPPSREFVDPLGLTRSLDTIDALAGAFSEAGTSPLGYSAVYAIGADEADVWDAQILRRESGEPYRLGENFLILVDPADPVWLTHYTTQLQEVLRRTNLVGFHLDQYGWPKFARTGAGRVDVAPRFAQMLETIRAAAPDAQLIFNNVNDFGTMQTATSPQDASYIEVWPPHETLQDLSDLVARTRALRPAHPPIMSAYLSCFKQDERGGLAAAKFAMAAIFAAGGTHLLLGETSAALTDPYYPNHALLGPDSAGEFARWYDFLVRYGDLLLAPDIVEVTGFYAGGINDDVKVIDPVTGASALPSAKAGELWVRVMRNARGDHMIHIVNLRDVGSTEWDAVKEAARTQTQLRFEVARGLVGDRAVFCTPDAASIDMETMNATDAGGDLQINALTAGQERVAFDIPSFTHWGMIWLPAPE